MLLDLSAKLSHGEPLLSTDPSRKQGCVSIFASQMFTDLTTDSGFFLAAAIGSLGWLAWEIRKAWKCKTASPESFIADLAKGTKQID